MKGIFWRFKNYFKMSVKMFKNECKKKQYYFCQKIPFIF